MKLIPVSVVSFLILSVFSCSSSESLKHVELAKEYKSKQMFEQAISEYEKALEINSSTENVSYELADLYYDKDELDKATSLYQKAIELSQNAEISKIYLENCQVKKNMYQIKDIYEEYADKAEINYRPYPRAFLYGADKVKNPFGHEYGAWFGYDSFLQGRSRVKAGVAILKLNDCEPMLRQHSCKGYTLYGTDRNGDFIKKSNGDIYSISVYRGN